VRASFSNETLGFGHYNPLGNYVEHGMYYRQLVNLYKHVNACQVHVMLTERLGNPALWMAEMNRLMWFLGFPPRELWNPMRVNARDQLLKRTKRTLPDLYVNESDVAEGLTMLKSVFKKENENLFAMLGKRVEEWN